MNEVVKTTGVVHFSEFFAPISPDLIASLLKQYDDKLNSIKSVAEYMESPSVSDAVSYFVTADRKKNSDRSYYNLEFDVSAAAAVLDSEFWQKALNLTDVYDHMPQDRRSEWGEMITDCKCVSFESDTVYSTIESLLNSRAQFLAERVDGMFRSLSGEHVTNSPSGFNKRMIIAGAIDHLDLVSWKVSGHLDDLRKVISKFLGHEECGFGTTSDALYAMKRCYGEWVEWDGGAIRAKLYMKGTVHLEIHPGVAWKLNEILAYIYPRSLSASSLKKPVRKSKVFNHIKRPIPGRVLNALSECVKYGLGQKIKIDWRLDKEMEEQVINLLESIGGVRSTYEYKFDRYGSESKTFPAVDFDYYPGEAISHIICSGVLPDQKSHQFYPTPEGLAEEAAKWCEIGDNDSGLEPSAGQGGLASYVNPNNLTCVEISELHCEILKSKNMKAICADFLDWAPNHQQEFDRALMNPPFSDGRAIRHLEAAAECLKPKGILVAILPSSFKDKTFMTGYSVQYSDIKKNMFVDASVNVVLMKIIRD